MKKELPLHDATFDGIIAAGKNCTLYFTNTDGRGCEITLNGVDALQMEDFREGNIVVIFEVTKGEKPSKTVKLERLYTPPHPTVSDDYKSKYQEFVRSRNEAIASGALSLVEMVPAIGADLLAVCESVSFKSYGDGS